MLVETSAIVAILLEEPDAGEFLERIDVAERPTTTIVNAFEAAVSVGRVLSHRGVANALVPKFLKKAGIAMIGIEPDLYDEVGGCLSAFRQGERASCQAELRRLFLVCDGQEAGRAAAFQR